MLLCPSAVSIFLEGKKRKTVRLLRKYKPSLCTLQLSPSTSQVSSFSRLPVPACSPSPGKTQIHFLPCPAMAHNHHGVFSSPLHRSLPQRYCHIPSPMELKALGRFCSPQEMVNDCGKRGAENDGSLTPLGALAAALLRTRQAEQ